MWFPLLFLACVPDPLPLPTQSAAAEAKVIAPMDRGLAPALYRKLYDYAFLPKIQYAEQRVRLRIWMRYMRFNRYQFGLLEELVARTQREYGDVDTRHRQIVETHEPAIGAIYDELWEGMNRGAPEAELAAIGEKLDLAHVREAELLDLRAQSVRALFDAQDPFLRSLTPQQETWFSDAIFALRHRLDPYANPGDFNALVGTVYVAGEFGALSRTTFDPNEDHLNIGGLWSEDPETLTGPYFQNARRDVILYMLLLEPAFPEALAAAMNDAPVPDSAFPTEAAGVPAEPAPGVPAEPAPASGEVAPGVPEAPTPGIPEAPTPGVPDAPAPG